MRVKIFCRLSLLRRHFYGINDYRNEGEEMNKVTMNKEISILPGLKGDVNIICNGELIAFITHDYKLHLCERGLHNNGINCGNQLTTVAWANGQLPLIL